ERRLRPPFGVVGLDQMRQQPEQGRDVLLIRVPGAADVLGGLEDGCRQPAEVTGHGFILSTPRTPSSRHAIEAQDPSAKRANRSMAARTPSGSASANSSGAAPRPT